MKFYTKEWYKEMQVFGFLHFPETKEEWEETINYYISEDIDYKTNFKEDLEWRKSDLLKFLPEFFHPYILDGTLNSEKELHLPEIFEGAYWLYDEVYPTEDGFELHVLFDCPFSEVKIKAEDVLIEKLDSRKE